MTDSPTGPVLSAAETRAAETLLAHTWGERTEVRAAETIWGRGHVVRLHLADDRSVVLKRRGHLGHGRRARGFGAELAALEYLNDMPVPVAPRLLGADTGMDAVERGKEPFLAVAASLGLGAGGVADEIDAFGPVLNRTGRIGFVQGDACPDNVRLLDGGCRIFDFETSGWGPVVLDASYLLAPFPSCWCFANLPADAAGPAVDAYRARLAAADIDLGPEWDAATTVALAAWIVARGEAIATALEEDREWGTTTMRPRLMAWLRNFIHHADGTGVVPRLQVLAAALHEQLSRRWPGLLTPDYPRPRPAGRAGSHARPLGPVVAVSPIKANKNRMMNPP